MQPTGHRLDAPVSKGNSRPLGHFEQMSTISKLLLKNIALVAERRTGFRGRETGEEAVAVISVI